MNPFIYGDYVRDEHFLNREKEVKDLIRDLLDSQKIFLISPRRFGKTSLLKKIIKELNKKKIKVAYVDLFKSSSLEQFIASFAKTVSMFESNSLEKSIKFVKELISSLRPLVSIKNDGEISIQIDAKPKYQETYNIFEELLEYPYNYAKKNNTKVVVMFDEFQEIMRWGGEEVEKFIRSIIQNQESVGYIFCGSKKDILNEMVSKKSRAFFGIGPIVYLDKIKHERWINYITDTFIKYDFKIEKEIPEKIIKKVNNIPYYIQFLAHELWDKYYDSKVLKSEYIEETIMDIVKKNFPSFEIIWDNLTDVQQRTLQGIALYDIENIFSNDFLTRHQIGSRQAMEKTIKLLIKKDIIEKDKVRYIFTDLWFGEWIRYFILN